MCGATGTCISLVIVGAIIGKYGSALVDHADAGWAGIAFIYIYDINFSYSFGTLSKLSILPIPSPFVAKNSMKVHVFDSTIPLGESLVV